MDPENAQALCEFEDGTKPDLENHCPKGSIVGKAKATTPLLERELSGNVRGEITVNLKGESSTTKAGKLVNTFNNVPDAPITKFNLNIAGG